MTTNKELRDLRRRQAADRNKAKELANRARQRLRDNQAARAADRTVSIRKHNAVVTGMVPRISAAINSWAGKRVPLRVTHPSYQFRAITDFRTISIDIPEIDKVDLDFAADLRGLAYHEAGHILKSIPFPNLIEAALPLGDEGIELSRDQWLRKAHNVTISKLHQAWNVLEDQRMESAMVRDSRNLGRYYNVIVLTHVLQRGVSPLSYTLLYGRKHVDETVRTAAFQAFVGAHGAPIAEQVENLIDAYKATDDLVTMWECVVKFCKVLQGIGADSSVDSIDGHEGYQESMDEDEAIERASESATPEDPTEGDDDSDGATDGGNAESDDEGDEAMGDTADRQATGQSDTTDHPGASNSVNDPDWSRDLLRDALEQAKEERRNDQNVLNDVKAFNTAMREGKEKLPLERIPCTMDPDPLVTIQASKLNRSLRNLMEQARAESAPSWQTQQNQGFLDVNRYLTRQPGDLDFYRNYAEGGDMHLPDMAVSLLLDGSGSMGHHAQALATAAFGIKSACDTVSVPCTVTVYDTDAYLLWDEEDRPVDVPFSIVPGGGTEPKRALDLLDFQKHGKKNHLIIIMTDGAWSHLWRSQYSLAHYQAPDRDFVMFYYQCEPGVGPLGAETCSVAQRIDDLAEMPKFLRRYITRAM